MDKSKLDLYYFNHKVTNPIVFLVVKIYKEADEEFLEEHTEYLFKTLIDNKLASSSNILIFNVIKEYNLKIVNWILPAKESNNILVNQLEKDKHIIDTILVETLKNCTCTTLLSFSEKELKIQDCHINLN